MSLHPVSAGVILGPRRLVTSKFTFQGSVRQCLNEFWGAGRGCVVLGSNGRADSRPRNPGERNG